MSILLTASVADVILIAVVCGCQRIVNSKYMSNEVLEKIKIALAIITLILLLCLASVAIKYNGNA